MYILLYGLRMKSRSECCVTLSWFSCHDFPAVHTSAWTTFQYSSPKTAERSDSTCPILYHLCMSGIYCYMFNPFPVICSLFRDSSFDLLSANIVTFLCMYVVIFQSSWMEVFWCVFRHHINVFADDWLVIKLKLDWVCFTRVQNESV